MEVEISLTNSNKKVKVDSDCPDTITKHNWYLSNTGYAVRGVWNGENMTTVLMHRELLSGKGDVDHINRDKLDNRSSNLRLVDRSTNSLNSGKRKHNTSGYKGVTWHKASGKWSAQIMVKGKKYHLGLYTEPQEASVAYQEKLKELTSL